MDEGRRPEKRARIAGDSQAPATEDEVEEFFAILRRIHEAARHLRRPLDRWAPEFEWEDFGGAANAVKMDAEADSSRERDRANGVITEERREKKRSFACMDLNEEPQTEHHAHFSG